MINKKAIEEELDRLASLKEMVETYEEISTSQMQKTRGYVLKTRLFIEDLASVFQQIKVSSRQELERLMEKRKLKDPTKLGFRETNGKTIYVMLSANIPLYGDIVRKTFAYFAEVVKKEKADVAIVGKLGLQYFLDEKLDIPYTYFELPDEGENTEFIKKIAEHIVQYERIYVFHGKFQSLVTQQAAMTSISGDVVESQGEPQTPVRYIFEPTLEKVMSFFENEILASIFEQAISESRLAKNASRLISLDTAVQSVSDTIKKAKQEKNRINHRLFNAKQLNVLTSISLWNT